MKKRTDLIVQVLKAADGRVVGKIRLQKIFYLLEQSGMASGLLFSYHHYGPYSEELSRALDYAELVDRAVKEMPVETSTGSTFIAYELVADSPNHGEVGSIDFQRAHDMVATMKAETSIVIELAATIHWLINKEKVADWRTELVRRKTTKAEPKAIERAESLLRALNLAA